MIFDQLDQLSRYRTLNPRFAAAFDYLSRPGLDQLPDGKIDLVPGEVWASVVRTEGRPLPERFEYHRRFADIHICTTGNERIGWIPTSKAPTAENFDVERDFGLINATTQDFLPMLADRFAILFPGELHAPLIGEGKLTKITMKVLLD
jgi:YhcH/YjgK/YiaL family protein